MSWPIIYAHAFVWYLHMVDVRIRASDIIPNAHRVGNNFEQIFLTKLRVR